MNSRATACLADRALKPQLSPPLLETRSNVASDLKQFTAMAVMMLVERGRLSYDDAVARHLSGLAKLIAPQEIQVFVHVLMKEPCAHPKTAHQICLSRLDRFYPAGSVTDKPE